jgi:hypothetical protein
MRARKKPGRRGVMSAALLLQSFLLQRAWNSNFTKKDQDRCKIKPDARSSQVQDQDG